MNQLSETAIMENIISCIQQHKASTCQALLDDFSMFTPSLQNKILFEISMAEDTMSLPILGHMIETGNISKKLNERILDLVLEKAHGKDRKSVV